MSFLWQKKHHTLALVACMLASVSTSLFAQSLDLKFETYIPGEGLPTNIGGDIDQDSLGFFWFSSSNGIYRFDGKKFKPYNHIPGDPGSLSSDFISDILIDSKGRMWLGTYGRGINLYDAQLDRFIHIIGDPSDPTTLRNNYVNSLCEDHEGRIWVATEGGLHLLKNWNQEKNEATFELFEDLPFTNLKSIVEFPLGTLWLATGRNGLIEYHVESRESKVYSTTDSVRPANLPSNVTKHLLADGDKLWVSTYGGGVAFAEMDEKGEAIFTSFTYQKEDTSSTPNPNISLMIKGRDNEYWLGSFRGGLIQMKLDSANHATFKQYLSEENNPNSLSSNSVHGLKMDDEGQLWISTTKGIQKIALANLSQNKKAFHHKRLPYHPHNKLQDIWALAEDNHGYIWLGTYGKGIYLYKEKTNYWRRLAPIPSSPKTLSSLSVTCITKEENEKYWVGTFNGLNKVEVNWQEDIPHTQFTHFKHDPALGTSLSNNRIFALFEEDSVLWVGTRGGGLNKLNKKTQAFTHYKYNPRDSFSISNNYIWSIEKDIHNRLWLATDKGICILDADREKFYSYKHDPAEPGSISNDFINVITRDKKGRMWIGTYGSGIDVVHEDHLKLGEPLSFLHIRQRDGLVNEHIYGIVADTSENIWVSTTHGMGRIMIEGWDGVHVPDARSFQKFFKEDGLQENEFNSSSYYVNDEGWVFMGGVNGFNKFHASELARNEHPPKIVFTSLQILNEQVFPSKTTSKGRTPLNKDMNQEGVIRLTHKDLVMSIEYAALDFAQASKNQYAYRLLGFDDAWTHVGNETKATFTNLREGHYEFQVKASNNDGVWNEEGKSIHIYVSPPPWRSWWAYLIYVFSVSGLLYVFVNFRIRQQARQLETQWKINQAKLQERERVRRDAAADFHDELGNKMTKISLFVELAKRQLDQPENQGEFLDKIADQTRQLSSGMRDFLWVLDPDKDTLYNVLGRAKAFGDELFEHTDTTFVIEGLDVDMEDIVLPVEQRRNLLMIIKEALHNVLKYADAGRCSLSIEVGREKLHISIRDNGKGFDPHHIKRGYGLENMSQRAAKMGADIDISSKVGEGSQVVLSLDYPR